MTTMISPGNRDNNDEHKKANVSDLAAVVDSRQLFFFTIHFLQHPTTPLSTAAG
jgi:hypothetical protein